MVRTTQDFRHLGSEKKYTHYVYLLESDMVPTHRYVGLSTDLKQRLADHNSGKSHGKIQTVAFGDVRYFFKQDKS